MDQVKFFKGCPLQILLNPFWNTLPQITYDVQTHSVPLASMIPYLT